MTAFSVQSPYPPFADVDGAPLENGYIWLGAAGLDPQSNPVTAYFDSALTIVAAQPIRTQGGYPVYQGAPARIYINGTNYSIRVMNKNGLTVYTALSDVQPLIGSTLDVTGAATLGSLDVTGAATLGVLTASGNVSFDGGSFVFNESGADKDARFEGDTDANLLFLDASTDQVGIGTATPGAKLDVDGAVIVQGSLTQADAIKFSGNTSAPSATDAFIYRPADNTLAFGTASSERMRIDASGNVGIGTTPTSALEVARGSAVEAGLSLRGNNNATAAELFVGQGSASEGFIYNRANEGLYFGTSNTERMRITSNGYLLVGKLAAGSTIQGVELAPAGIASSFTRNGGASCIFVGNSNQNVVEFAYSSTVVGSISITASSTAYNQSSDYRLKNNQQPLTGSGAFIDALQPKTWDWKIDGSRGVGFIAHEVQAVSPSTVVGEKDAVDAEGKPVMQQLAYASPEFIANIVAELQSLRARVAALEAK